MNFIDCFFYLCNFISPVWMPASGETGWIQRAKLSSSIVFHHFQRSQTQTASIHTTCCNYASICSQWRRFNDPLRQSKISFEFCLSPLSILWPESRSFSERHPSTPTSHGNKCQLNYISIFITPDKIAKRNLVPLCVLNRQKPQITFP